MEEKCVVKRSPFCRSRTVGHCPQKLATGKDPLGGGRCQGLVLPSGWHPRPSRGCLCWILWTWCSPWMLWEGSFCPCCTCCVCLGLDGHHCWLSPGHREGTALQGLQWATAHCLDRLGESGQLGSTGESLSSLDLDSPDLPLHREYTLISQKTVTLNMSLMCACFFICWWVGE